MSPGRNCIPGDTCRFMTFFTPTSLPSSSGLTHTHIFASPLYPAHVQLLLDFNARTAVLLRMGEGESLSLLHSQLFTSTGMRVFLALLQAYPQHCEFEHLFTCLDLPQPAPGDGQRHGSEWEMTIRPVRRVIAALSSLLPAFGLHIVSLRNRGYLLVLDAEAFSAMSSERPALPAKDTQAPSHIRVLMRQEKC